MQSQTFRVFVSSTFADFESERNTLQEEVFPRLRTYCESCGFRFEPIDLRWGINEEAGLDQQTMRICLGELENCQRISPRLNFIILAGSRYGWRPLPAQIDADEFERLMAHTTPEERARLRFDETRPDVSQGEGNGWYRCDENAVPPAYVLLPREANSEFANRERWAREEAALHRVLRSAAAKEFPNPAARERAKYFHSATHREIERGLFRRLDARDHVFAYLKEDDAAESSEEDREAMRNLKAQIAAYLPEEHVFTSGQSGESWIDVVQNHLKRVIDEEIDRYESASEHETENALHRAFAQERARHFVGREDALEVIADSIASDSPHPFFVHGVSGSGKTALLAKAWQQAVSTPSTTILARFIGATPKSGNLENLLTDLCEQLEPVVGPLEEDAEPESAATPSNQSPGANLNRLTRRFEALLQQKPAGNRLVLFIDAIDQLNAVGSASAHTLAWLPRQLPPGVRLIVSALHRPSNDASPHASPSFHPGQASESARQRFPNATHLDLPKLPPQNAQELLRDWLAAENRRLTEAQKSTVLTAFQVHGLPLWLRLAIDQAKRWRSFDPIPQSQPLPEDIPNLISARMEELRQEKNHGRLLVDKMLGFLKAAVTGLSTNELLEVLARDDEFWGHFTDKAHHTPNQRRIPAVLWARLHAGLATYLTERQADGAMLHTIYHRVIAEWIGTNIPGRPFHEQLADYFGNQTLYLDGDDAETASEPNLRKLSELVPQQIKAERWDDLVGTVETPGPLTDLRFVQAKCEAGLGYGLSDDYHAALTKLPELAGEREEDESRREQCRRYAQTIAEYGHRRRVGESPSLPEPPARVPLSNELCDDTKIDAKPIKDLTRAERLQYFGSFYSTNRTILLEDSKSTLGQAYNQAATGEVSEQADLLLRQCTRLWLARAGRLRIPLLYPACVSVFEGHSGRIGAASLSADGCHAISGSFDATARIWHIRSGQCLAILKGHESAVTSVGFNWDGSRALSASMDQTLRLWNSQTGQCLLVLEGHSSSINAAVLSADGAYAVSGAYDETLRIWDMKNGNCIRTLRHCGPVLNLALSADATRAITSSQSDCLRYWDTISGQCISTLGGLSNSASPAQRSLGSSITSVDLSPDGMRVVSGGRDQIVRVWEAETGKCLGTLTGHSGAVWAVAWSADGSRLLSGSMDGTLRVWCAQSGQCLATVHGHGDTLTSVAWSSDGSQALSGSFDHALRLWDLKKGQYLKSHDRHYDIVKALNFSSDGSRVVSHSSDNSIHYWDTDNGTVLSSKQGPTGWVGNVGISAERDIGIFGFRDNTLKLWGIHDEQCVKELKGHSGYVDSVAFSCDGRWAASGGNDETMRVWDTETGDCVARFGGHGDDVTAVALTPDGALALSASNDALRIWDAGRKRRRWPFSIGATCVAQLGGHYAKLNSGERVGKTYGPNRICAAAMCANKTHVLSSSIDCSLRFWSIETGACLATLEGHTDEIGVVALSPDANWALSGSNDKTLRIWNIPSGTCLFVYQVGAAITSMDVHFKSGRVVCGCWDGQVHFLTIRNWDGLEANPPR